MLVALERLAKVDGILKRYIQVSFKIFPCPRFKNDAFRIHEYFVKNFRIIFIFSIIIHLQIPIEFHYTLPVKPLKEATSNPGNERT